jgi:hypothetical protein
VYAICAYARLCRRLQLLLLLLPAFVLLRSTAPVQLLFPKLLLCEPFTSFGSLLGGIEGACCDSNGCSRPPPTPLCQQPCSASISHNSFAVSPLPDCKAVTAVFAARIGRSPRCTLPSLSLSLQFPWLPHDLLPN